jgi:hypothetical protein
MVIIAANKISIVGITKITANKRIKQPKREIHMNKVKVITSVTILVGALALSGCGSKPTGKAGLMTLNGKEAVSYTEMYKKQRFSIIECSPFYAPWQIKSNGGKVPSMSKECKDSYASFSKVIQGKFGIKEVTTKDIEDTSLQISHKASDYMLKNMRG